MAGNMKISRIIVLFLSFFLIAGCAGKEKDIKVMTLNIRYDNPADSINAWPNRKTIVTSFISSQKPDLFGMQEVLWHQYEFIDSALQGYGSVSVGRDDGVHAGEAAPVFYRLDRFTLHEKGTFWLSATPDVPGSIGWGAACTRIVTWARLTDKFSGDTILFMNTHFDHISDSARVMSAQILREKLTKLARQNKFIITGDFNALPASLAISTITGDGLIKDSYSLSLTSPAGEKNTFNFFSDDSRDDRIDYIFVREGMKVSDYNVPLVKREGIFISDHWPVTITINK
jgi:endonuclease/exonuclease/phosphatase family metal-dependent hydrolase